jgi:hypothetical protein
MSVKLDFYVKRFLLIDGCPGKEAKSWVSIAEEIPEYTDL